MRWCIRCKKLALAFCTSFFSSNRSGCKNRTVLDVSVKRVWVTTYGNNYFRIRKIIVCMSHSVIFKSIFGDRLYIVGFRWIHTIKMTPTISIIKIVGVCKFFIKHWMSPICFFFKSYPAGANLTNPPAGVLEFPAFNFTRLSRHKTNLSSGVRKLFPASSQAGLEPATYVILLTLLCPLSYWESTSISVARRCNSPSRRGHAVPSFYWWRKLFTNLILSQKKILLESEFLAKYNSCICTRSDLMSDRSIPSICPCVAPWIFLHHLFCGGQMAFLISPHLNSGVLK